MIQRGGKILNPETGRYVKIDGKLGQSILQKTDLCQAYPKRTKEFVPTPYQKNVLRFFEEVIPQVPEIRGLLLYWGLGSGKTCGAIGVIDHILRTQPERHIYIFTAGALKYNFIEQYCRVCGTERLDARITFITYNQSNLLEALDRIDLDGSFIFVDEAHHVWHGYTNESPQYSAMYRKLKSARDTLSIYLTGTPLLTHTAELPALLGLLYRDFDQIVGKRPFPYTEKEQIQEWIDRVVYPYFPRLRGEYPETSECFIGVPIRLQNHRNRYIDQVEDNIRLGKARPEMRRGMSLAQFQEKMAMWFLNYTMMASRQISNVYIGSTRSERLKRNGRELPDVPEPRGWMNETDLEELPYFSPKMDTILKIIQQKPGKHVVYSYFVQRYGTDFISSVLQLAGIPSLQIDGSMDTLERQNILNRFNSDENAQGERYKVLVISNAVSEGVTLLAVQTLHVMEQTVQEWQIEQLKGRVARLNSHIQLPPEQRKVDIYRYVLSPSIERVGDPEYDPFIDINESSDVYSYNKGAGNLLKVAPYIEAMKSSRFEEMMTE